MNEPLDESYFTWLADQVGAIRPGNRSRTHWKLLRLLYRREFVWLIANDDNRVEDGRDLRREFLAEIGGAPDQEWVGLGCSFLEVVIGLARRLAFEAEGEPRDWFWHMVNNIGLAHLTDNRVVSEDRVFEVLDRVIWRNYSSDGSGGLFPLNDPVEDQRQVELWMQLSCYILELEE